MNHARTVAAVAGTYLGAMSGVLMWAAYDWWQHQWRPTHR